MHQQLAGHVQTLLAFDGRGKITALEPISHSVRVARIDRLGEDRDAGQVVQLRSRFVGEVLGKSAREDHLREQLASFEEFLGVKGGVSRFEFLERFGLRFGLAEVFPLDGDFLQRVADFAEVVAVD